MSSSKLAVGIVGLPNVGKSTLFNALLKKQQAYAANFPFATIDPNIGVVPVPDNRLLQLAEVVKKSDALDLLPPQIPATCEFVDIAGLIAGAHKGEGLGNKFLSHIREVDAILHVVRNFSDENIIREGSENPTNDLEIIETELMMADLFTLENQVAKMRKEKDNLKFKSAVEKGIASIQKSKPIRNVEFDDQEKTEIKQLSLLTSKPILVVLNSDESVLPEAENIEQEFANNMGLTTDQIIVVSAKLEEELAGLSADDQKVYLGDMGLLKSGLERVVNKAFSTLGLISFLTAGKKEVRAWTIRKGINAHHASGVIHTDFMNKFIKADVVNFKDFVNYGGWKMCRELGKVRAEGRDYIMKEGDVVEFKVGS